MSASRWKLASAAFRAHAGRFHVNRLEVHGVDGQSVNILIGVLLVDLNLFEAGAVAVISAGIAGFVGGVRSGGVGLGIVAESLELPHADREKAREPANRMPSRAAIFLFFIAFSSFSLVP